MTPRGLPFVVSMMNEGETDVMGQQAVHLHVADLCLLPPIFFFENPNVAACVKENFFFS